ncbi:DegQ family serine endoprotease [Mailhella massiliensis]|uniref:Probable periplasmic serine endoprotease DegP-like n=1 Tax=Mailhella massiliensis TaxID=1903261 RepID=A0A921AVJ8_9BACT|nr:DegQ family serine endoprotease [Mailhella massiliensis]HJD96538.1 DegQ family serine endoprotease [Mailhella massiliensis]
MNGILKKTALAVTGFVFLATSASAAPTLPDFVPLAKSAGPAVVNISTEREVESPVMDMFNFPGMEHFFEQFGGPFGRQPGQPMPKRKSSALGSGFIISSDGYIVTNNHVVEGADKVTVKFNGDKSAGLPAKVVGTDEETDLALLKVESKEKLPVLKFGDSDALEVGDWVLAIGNPFGLSNTVTAGILSAKGRDIHSGPFDNFLQTDASINPGNSGGPLINMAGEVIGINTAISANGQGIGFAIPSNLASRVIDDLRAGKKVSRGWLGVTVQDVEENMARALGLKDTRGALIGSVMPGEPAFNAGLLAGDVIIRVGDHDIDSASALTRSVAGLKPDTKVDVVVLRNGKEKKMTVKLGERASHSTVSKDAGQSEGTELGVSVQPLSPEDARALQLSGDVKGLLVVNVKNGSPAAEGGLRSGDVILSANLQPVTKVDELASIVRKEGKERGAVMLQVNRRGDTFFLTVTLDKK